MSVAPEPVNPEHDPMTIDPANLGSVDPLSVEGLFLVALGKTGDARAAFLAEQCGDEDRRQRVEALLAAYENAGSFLEKPAIAIEPIPMGQYLAPCEVPGTIGKLGPYEILEEIGRGGMGVVFRAHDPKLQRIVAVKALAPELARLPSARQRFLREARAAAAISHPHVVTIFAVDGTEEASLGAERTMLPYLVMECIVGQTLHDKIKRQGALKTEEIVRISRQIAEGLGAAHKRGLIHRDIKPANILLENGVERVKITDFGLARTVSDGGITHTGEILGTPQCMSPEQARGEIVDQRSDLFSLGCVMYTMCTGVSPFRADNMLAVMKKVCEVTPRPIAQLNKDIPEWLCSLVHQLLEKEPERRVQTAGNVVEVLEARAVASGPRPAHTSVDPRTATSPHPHPEAVPQGLQSPIAPNWIRKWQGDVCEFGLLSLLLGTVNSHVFRDGFVSFLESLFLGVLFWAGAVLFQLFIGQQRWIRWSVFGASIGGLAAGGMLGAAINQVFRSYPAGMAILIGLMVATGLQVARWLAHLWNQNHSTTNADSTESSPREFQPSTQLRTPWSLLGWLLVGVLSAGVIGILLLAIGVLIPYLSMNRAKPQVATIPTASSAYVQIYSSLDEKITGVSVDGTPAFVTQISQSLWQMQTTPGSHDFVISFTSPAPDIERVYTTTLNIGINDVCKIEAVPINRATDRKNNSQAMEPFLPADPVEVRSLTKPLGMELPTPLPTDKPLGTESTAQPASLPEAVILSPPRSAASEVPLSIPLADSIEVLTDPDQMPAPTTGMVYGAGIEMTQSVWIDEPGLLIRMKRLGFEGNEGTDLEYYSKVAWGTGAFMATNSLGEHAHHFPAGRYQVLVQDLDYGWALDRRGTITIGNGPLYVHVKRSFDAHQLHSDGDTPFPVPFRWAGKTYQIHNHVEIAAVNGLLAATNSVNPVSFATPNSFRKHLLFQEAVETDSPEGHSLKRERTVAQIDIQSADMQAGFISPLGRLEWKGPQKTPVGLYVPRQELRMFVKDELMGWYSPEWYDNHPIATDDPLATPLVARRDRALIKKFAETVPAEGQAINVWFYWFGTETDLPRKSAPAIRRLISAWADEHPDVPEAELLPLGGATSFEELWKLPTPAAAIPAVNEKDEPKPEFVHPAFLVPGSTPATWRLKEPPEGAVAEE